MIEWSAENEPTIASGSVFAMRRVANPMAAAESFGEGSATMRLRHSSGSCSATWSRWLSPVTTQTLSSPTSGATRSHVDWRRLRPVPSTSWRNFGDALRESGQSRVPDPPAGMMAWKCVFTPSVSQSPGTASAKFSAVSG
ncbi:Uncharacterised protein [Mycobacteroides abscessus subsp. abscessus]|nr:Uncharacterised protein [Mycobacteroides abscessus subsp. abscessus]